MQRSCDGHGDISETTRRDGVGERGYIWSEHSVLFERLNELAHHGNGLLDGPRRAERPPILHPLCRAHELDPHYMLHVTHHALELPRGAHSHRHDVFLTSVRWDRIHARG